MKRPLPALLTLLSLLLSGCANYKLNYAPAAENWENQEQAPNSGLSYTLYLLGDLEARYSGEYASGLEMLSHHIRNAGENSGIIFLGNQVAADSKSTGDKEREERLKEHLKGLKGFPGELFFLPGENDWEFRGVKGLEWQKELIGKYLDREEVWFPDPGCSGPEEVELTEDLVLLLVDSEWYLRDWEGEIDINSDCEVKSREVFRWLVNEEIKGNRHKNTVVAMHHPLISYGPHGGSHHLKEHLFPLTVINRNLYIPLPVIGSISTYLQSSTGDPRDIFHPVYQEMVGAFMDPARQNGRYIFAGAHDQSLQYIERDSQVFIGSGAGSNHTTPVHAGKDAHFAFSRPGFARMDFYKDGSAWVYFWAAEGQSQKGRLVFQKKIKEPFPEKVDPPEVHFEQIAPGETIKVTVSERDYRKGRFWRFLFGEHYRNVYRAEIEVPLFDLTRFKGGVVPVKRGGGAQTNSIRLEDRNGRQYTLRSIDKDATRTVPYPFNKDIVLDIVEDNFSASHPFGALAAAALSDELGIYHTNPKVVYLPRQAALGDYNDDYAGALYLLEDRPDDEVWKDAASFGYPEKIESTEDLLEELKDNHDHVLDDEALLYARLFDMVLGDWDRHDDQWRWGRTDQDSLKVYYPIPRDRDQVFSHYDGFAGHFVRQTAPNSKQFKPFRASITNTKWENYNGRFLDQSLLTGLEWKDWEAAAKRLQDKLTDEAVDNALRKSWPDTIYHLDGPQIAWKLRSRRDQLMDAARERYLFLAKRVDVTGTGERDLFEVEQLDDDRVRVRVFDTNEEKEKELLFYDRTFLRKETEEINLYGLEDEDIFIFIGEKGKGPRIHVIGGLGEDTYENLRGGAPVHIYDHREESSGIIGEEHFVKHLSDDPSLNLYNRRAPAYEYNYSGYFPSVAFNPEDGIFLGMAAQFTTYGFHRAPFASRHNVSLGLALRTKGLLMKYEGVFTDFLGLWDLQLDLDAQTPLYTNNFFGFGNLSPDLEKEEGRDRDYHQVRLARVSLFPALLRRYNSGGSFSVGPTLEYFSLKRTPGRFIDDIAESLPQDIFDGKWYTGLRAEYRYRNQDDQPFPSRGLALEISGGWKFLLGQPAHQFGFIRPVISFYQKLEPKGRIVFATRLGIDHRLSDHFEFFQGATIGGSGPEANFRGLSRDRYTGRTALFQNIDLRIKILDSSQWGLPMSAGILGGFDHGRIWNKGGEKNSGGHWHHSYGAGIWVSPLNMILVNFSVFRNDANQNLFTLQGSFFF